MSRRYILNVYPDGADSVQSVMNTACVAARDDPGLQVVVQFAPGRYDLGGGNWLDAGDDASLIAEVHL